MGTIERLENTVNSLRSAVSSSGSGGGTSTDFDAALIQEVAGQRAYVCALLSLRVNYKALRNASLSTAGGSSSHISASSSGSSSAGGRGNRGGGIAGRRGGDDHQEGDDDYYSAEAKLMRKAKRRRLSDSTGSDSPISPYSGGPGQRLSGMGSGGGGGVSGGNMPAMRGYGASGGSGLSIPAPAAQKTGIVAAMEKDRLAAVRVSRQ